MNPKRVLRGWALGRIAAAALLTCGTAALAQPLSGTPGEPTGRGQLGVPGQPTSAGALPVPAGQPFGVTVPPPPTQAWRMERYLGATVTATDNSDLSSVGPLPEDVVVDIEPRLVLRGRGASYTLNADIAAHVLYFTKDSQDSRILPVANAVLNGELVERWFYVDASFSADQISQDPYALRTDFESTRNKINTFGYRLSPYLKHDFSPTLSVQARNDNLWTKRRGEFAAFDPRRNSHVQRNSFQLDKRPLPLGFSAEGMQEVTRYTAGNNETVLDVSSARGVVTYAPDPTLQIGIVGGVEKSIFALTSTTDEIAGMRLTWAPTERSQIRATAERRFFGNGGSLQVSHRSPFIGITVSAAREPTATGSSFVLVPELGTVRTLLDSIYTTRYPDPQQRRAVVDSVIDGLGTPNVLGTPLEVFASYAQLRESFNASVVFQGVQTTVITRFYVVQLEQLSLASTPLSPGPNIRTDNRQKGLSVDVTRRLTPSMSAIVSLGYADIYGLGLASGQSAKNRNVRLTLTRDLSPRTKLSARLRYQTNQIVDPSVNSNAKEVAAAVGIVHKF